MCCSAAANLHVTASSDCLRGEWVLGGSSAAPTWEHEADRDTFVNWRPDLHGGSWQASIGSAQIVCDWSLQNVGDYGSDANHPVACTEGNVAPPAGTPASCTRWQANSGYNADILAADFSMGGCRLCNAAAGDGGGHRLLGESSMFHGMFQSPTECSWDTIDDAANEIEAVCCSGTSDPGCASGMPEQCSYNCGKIFVPFLELCGDMLGRLFAHDTSTLNSYQTLRTKCLQLDPKTMVLAIAGSECVTCGDGEVTAEDEDCDAGLEGNSDEPDAHCRTDCHLARCGDGIVDTGLTNANLEGKIVLIQRGVCPFVKKALNAQNAGAAAVIIYDNSDSGLGSTNVMGQDGDVNITILSVFMNRVDGAGLAAAVNHDTTTVSLRCDQPDRCSNDDIRVEWSGGVHETGTATFGAQQVQPALHEDLELVLATPLNGCGEECDLGAALNSDDVHVGDPGGGGQCLTDCTVP